MSDLEISEQAIEFVKKNKKTIIEKFASAQIYKPCAEPETFFMAGSPGAGKTETSKDFIAKAEEEINQKLGTVDEYKIVRIDGDEIRNMLPGYTGDNSDLFQRAISSGVSKLVDYCFSKKLNMLVDGTFASPNSIENIDRAIKHKRSTNIIYVYQDPLKAWELTRARQAKDGRIIPLEAFVDSFFLAKENINKVKETWGDKVQLDYAERDFETDLIKYEINIGNLDNYLKLKYNKTSLTEAINAMGKCN